MPEPLIDAAHLIARLDNPRLRVVDARFSLADPGLGRRQYEAGHIPGALYLDLERDLSGPVVGPGGRHPLPDLDTLARRLGATGIGNDSWVVAYDAAHGEFAGRLWWLLRYLGHDAVQVLNGGLAAFLDAGGRVSETVPAYPPTVFTPQPRPDLLVSDQAAVEEAARNGLLVDSRAGPRYRGEVEPLDRRAGHIPGARHYDFTRVLAQDGRFRTSTELQARFRDLPESPVVYCGSGVTATVNVIAMELAGLRPRLYAGSYSDWVSSDARPVAIGPERPDPDGD